MKFTLPFKTPGVLDFAFDAITDAHHCEDCDEYTEDCDACILLEDQACQKMDAIRKCAEKFIKYGECITVEFDTDANTATVLPIEK